MAQTPTKIEYPTGQDPFQPHRDIKQLAESATVIVPVSNREEADAIADVYQPTPLKPLFVDRADTGELERTHGSGWVSFSRSGLDGFVQRGWGEIPGDLPPNTGAAASVQFNSPLSTIPDVIVVPSGTARVNFRVLVNSITHAGFDVEARNNSNGTTSAATFRWFAFA